MTTKAASFSHSGDGSTLIVTWPGMANGNDGQAVPLSQWADRSVQVTGTFGASGNIRWEGSNDGGTTWAVLHDPQGVDLDIGAAGIKGVTEITELARPRATAGDGTTSLTVTLLARRMNPMRT